jgi:hypothetical protein
MSNEGVHLFWLFIKRKMNRKFGKLRRAELQLLWDFSCNPWCFQLWTGLCWFYLLCHFFIAYCEREQGRTQVHSSGGIDPHSIYWIPLVFIQILKENRSSSAKLCKDAPSQMLCPRSDFCLGPPLEDAPSQVTVRRAWRNVRQTRAGTLRVYRGASKAYI